MGEKNLMFFEVLATFLRDSTPNLKWEDLSQELQNNIRC